MCPSLCSGFRSASSPSQSPTVTALPKGEPMAAHGQRVRDLSDALAPPLGQRRRPRPAADTGRSCWGSGQQDASAAQGTKRMLGAATRRWQNRQVLTERVRPLTEGEADAGCCNPALASECETERARTLTERAHPTQRIRSGKDFAEVLYTLSETCYNFSDKRE